jgi:hypothetical protein
MQLNTFIFMIFNHQINLDLILILELMFMLIIQLLLVKILYILYNILHLSTFCNYYCVFYNFLVIS